ncbi:unnamed protein product [Rotaria magnacalcarata]|uniref:ABM domain-containing protein n=2 Tax=Rotaria magnacalcarata TaxID=392030 RepID=A0A816UGB5_9BILA|nr:unnamed protein product [Rotaria magnacalcarata]CAF2108559.1 unnamed protein product [Rotaria magnacalcarata]CAF2172958.1 unnamed protein product [Rotaria magnacalcarata]CAF3927392.1 unnamed protein product [Rotaria magnacalcarata]CAF4080260.1 unnamed protein product [Rotaria magnacalcarata]
MTLLLHVEFDATSESTATKILESLARMADIVHRDHPKVYTYVFRYGDETKTKLIFTEIYADEQVFLDHGRDAEFGRLLLEAFDTTTGKSRKELCIRSDINSPLSQITASILDNYLHVTYVSLQQGFFHRELIQKREVDLLIVCTGCDQNVYQQLNSLVSCATCVTFEESDANRQLIAVIENISSEKPSMTDKKPSIDAIEIVCSHEETIRKFKDIIDHYFQIQSIHVQTSFSGYIRHKSLS